MNYSSPSFLIHRYDDIGRRIVPSVIPANMDPDLPSKSSTIAPRSALALLAAVAFGATTIGEWVHSVLAYNNMIVSVLLILAVPATGLFFYGLVKLVAFCRYQRQLSEELSEDATAHQPSETPAEQMMLDPAMRRLPDYKSMPRADRRRIKAPVWERRRRLAAERRTLPFPDRREALSHLKAA